MNRFTTSLIWVTLGSSVLALAIDQTEWFPDPEANTVATQCPSHCQGDFPVSSERKYAQSPGAPWVGGLSDAVKAKGAARAITEGRGPNRFEQHQA
jgi:hypothetical protein